MRARLVDREGAIHPSARRVAWLTGLAVGAALAIAVARFARDHWGGVYDDAFIYSQLPILDLVGLTEPAIARAGRTVPPELLTRRWIGHERHCRRGATARSTITAGRETPGSWLVAACAPVAP